MVKKVFVIHIGSITSKLQLTCVISLRGYIRYFLIILFKFKNFFSSLNNNLILR